MLNELLDHLVGEREHRRWDFKAEAFDIAGFTQSAAERVRKVGPFRQRLVRKPVTGIAGQTVQLVAVPQNSSARAGKISGH